MGNFISSDELIAIEKAQQENIVNYYPRLVFCRIITHLMSKEEEQEDSDEQEKIDEEGRESNDFGLEILGVQFDIDDEEIDYGKWKFRDRRCVGDRKIVEENLWLFAFSEQFSKSIKRVDKKLKGRILEAIGDICRNPTTAKGNTTRPLTGEHSGLWRYRVGDYRLIYEPDNQNHRVTLLTFSPRGGAY